MLQDFQGTDEIVSYFKDLMERENGKYALARIFGMAKRYEEEQNKKNEIEKELMLSIGECVLDTTIVNDDIAIVEIQRKQKEGNWVYFQPVIHGRRYHEVSETFDYALILALGKKYDVSSFAPQAICNILQMDEYEKKNRPKTFIERVKSGEAKLCQLDEAIEEWKESKSKIMELHEYLGLSIFEYQEVILKDQHDVLQKIIDLQKNL
ncbi:hypothetical protein JOD82_002227 [Paenibacillus sp. 1182]|uniref:hypothetical protein n=1 Tax=Paenibacillus sp. 1182 TaxID=2806565 RepID=UPI001AE6C4A4|nr:hypothetical protein [Paenibacillus sp. 1182]MBP1309207.1 hypothetical protein [Paenibacillus sp. 1182]